MARSKDDVIFRDSTGVVTVGESTLLATLRSLKPDVDTDKSGRLQSGSCSSSDVSGVVWIVGSGCELLESSDLSGVPWIVKSGCELFCFLKESFLTLRWVRSSVPVSRGDDGESRRS